MFVVLDMYCLMYGYAQYACVFVSMYILKWHFSLILTFVPLYCTQAVSI